MDTYLSIYLSRAKVWLWDTYIYIYIYISCKNLDMGYLSLSLSCKNLGSAYLTVYLWIHLMEKFGHGHTSICVEEEESDKIIATKEKFGGGIWKKGEKENTLSLGREKSKGAIAIPPPEAIFSLKSGLNLHLIFASYIYIYISSLFVASSTDQRVLGKERRKKRDREGEAYRRRAIL